MPISWSGIPGFDVAVLSRPRAAGGGDYHAVVAPPGSGCMAVAVGDVAGHDAMAAGLMEVAGRLLRRHRVVPGRLATVMEAVNRDLIPHMRAGRFMTLFLAALVAGDRAIHWVSAGHAPGLAYDPTADVFREVAGPDIPLGIDPSWRFRELDHVGWATGALLVVGTDGIWETRAPNGAMYSKSRLARQIRAHHHRSAPDILAAVEGDLADFRAGRTPSDDATLMVVKAIETPPPPG